MSMGEKFSCLVCNAEHDVPSDGRLSVDKKISKLLDLKSKQRTYYSFTIGEGGLEPGK